MTEALNAALESINQSTTQDEKQQLIFAKCRAMMVGYDSRWRGEAFETIETEKQFNLPVINPTTGRASKTWTHAGKKDGIVRYGGRKYLLEHKTTSEDISDQGNSYWRRLTIDSQVSGYMLAEWQNGNKLDGTLYDVLRKPKTSPKAVTKALQTIMIQDGTYLGVEVPESLRTLEKESIELYEIRVTQEIQNDLERHFQRKAVPRLDGELVEYATEIWAISKDLLSARKNNRHYRNSDACQKWNSLCEFIDICSGHDTPESDNWKQRESIHSELEGLQDPLSVLTNSRIKCFQTCRKKHFYRYELGITKFEEESEALFMGTVIHAALRAWWDCYYRKENCDDNTDSYGQ